MISPDHKIALGTNRLGIRPDFLSIIPFAIEIGYRLFDTASFYGESEVIIGKSLVDRENVQIVSKYRSEHSLEKSLDNSLSNLQTDYIDAYLVHNYFKNFTDDDIKRTIELLQNYKQQGKIKQYGLDNVSYAKLERWQLVEKELGIQGIDIVQVEYQEDTRLIPHCIKNQIQLLFYKVFKNNALEKSRNYGIPMIGSLDKEHIKQNFIG